MFTKEIRDMTLANDIADRLFNNIIAHQFMDNTFKATLRAVLHGRLPNDESLHLSIIPLSDYCITPDMISEMIRRNDLGHTYAVYILYPQDRQYGDQMLEAVRSGVGKGRRYLDAYTPLDDLRVFYVKMLKGLFYTTGYSTLIFLDSLDIRRYHALQMMIPRYFPLSTAKT